MQSSRGRVKCALEDQHLVTPQPMRYGWPGFDHGLDLHQASCSEQTQGAASQPACTYGESAPSLSGSAVRRLSSLALPHDKTITISVIAGPSKGLTHQLTKPLITIGRTSAGADIEIDDPRVSRLHCVIGVKHGMIRLCDLDSANGTHINAQCIQAAGLEHLSEFRIGSSLLLVTIFPKG
jgi:type III secretion system (T3SS) inner membrane Yop/YscD-like protein